MGKKLSINSKKIFHFDLRICKLIVTTENKAENLVLYCHSLRNLIVQGCLEEKLTVINKSWKCQSTEMQVSNRPSQAKQQILRGLQ